MDKEKDNSNIEEKVTISDLAEKAAAMKQEEPKPKKRIGLGIMATVLIILLVGGALATGYLWGNSTVKPADNTGTSNESTTQPENSESKNSADTKMVNDETEVKELISQVYDTLKEKAERPTPLMKTYNYANVYYQSDDMANPTNLEETYGIYYDYGDASNTQNLSEDVKSIFSNLGFNPYKIANGIDELPDFVGFVNNDKQTVCATAWSALGSMYINCGKTSWISDSKKKLINELSKAMGEEISNPGNITVDESYITNSSISPYQSLEAHLPNGTALFYRNSPDSEWKYFTSAQMAVPCEKYLEHPDAENVKKAFADQECLKDSSGAKLKISEL